MALHGPSEFAQPARLGDLTPYLRKLVRGETLSESDSRGAFEEIASGESHDAEVGAFLGLLATRLPTVDEIVGAATVMRARVERVPCKADPSSIVDTAGTGGAPKSFNVSTAAAIVAAAAGATVAKHGNRSRTGRGSAEVMERIGVHVNATPTVQARCLDEIGICFCFAIHHHPAAKHVMPVRKALGIPTIFNLLGPLTNPAGAGRQLMGVYAREFVRPIAESLVRLGSTRALVIHSDDGLDEISAGALTHVAEVRNGEVNDWIVDPAALGLAMADPMSLAPHSLDEAAELLQRVLSGEDRGARRSMVLLNAAGALLAADRVATLHDGLVSAAESIDRGLAQAKLRALCELSRSV
ncbi:MAG: anthranilate phosphoribosyltransferase [Planctomycetota bacterium]|jgi:anthranilate phosphoribosyltransferase